MTRRTAAVAMLVGLLTLLGPSPSTAGAQTATPTITVTPSTGLVHQQTVQVTGQGFPPPFLMGVLTCPAGAPVESCDLASAVTLRPGVNGTFAVTLVVNRYPSPGVDCTTDPCEVVASSQVGEQARYPVTFASVDEPQLSAVLDLYGTLDDRGVAVASAVISCDRPTQVSVVGELRQPDQIGGPGVDGAFSLTDQCTPEQPVWAFFRITRAEDPEDDPELSTPWALGPATLSVFFRPTSPAGMPQESEMADITLLDQEPLAVAIQTALQDPAEVELRAAIVRAIQARVRQDPVFAAEWWALIGG